MPRPPGELLSRDFFARPSREVAPELLGCVLEHETPAGLVAVELTEVEAYEGVSDPASHSYRGRTARNAVMWGPPGFIYVYFTYGMHYCVNVVCQPAGTSSAVLIRAGRIVTGDELARQRRAVRPRPPSALGPPSAAPGPGAPAGPGSVPGTGSVPGPGSAPGTGSVPGPGAVPGANPAPAPAAVPARRLPYRDLARGPGRLGQALAITLAENGLDGCDPDSPLRLRPPAARPGGTDASRPSDGAGTRPPDDAARAGRPILVSTGPRVGVSAAADVPWRYWVAGDPTVSVYRPAKQRPAAPRPDGRRPDGSRSVVRVLPHLCPAPGRQSQCAPLQPHRTRCPHPPQFRLGRLELLRQVGRTLDLTGLPASRRVRLAPRGTGRRKAGRDPGSHQELLPEAARVPITAARRTEGQSWCLEGQRCRFRNLPDSFRKRS